MHQPARLTVWLVAVAFGAALPPVGLCADLMQQWAARARQVDSLYVEGRIPHFRVPAGQDPTDPTNWLPAELEEDVTFQLWLRRPDFRIRVRVARDEQPVDSEFAWVDGKLWVMSYDERGNAGDGVGIIGRSRTARLRIEAFLTPVEYHFFDVPEDDVPAVLAQRPYQVEGDTVVIEIAAEKKGYSSLWGGRIEFNPAAGYCPRRMSLWIGSDPETQQTRNLEVLETTIVDGIPLIRKARIVTWNRRRPYQFVWLWEAEKIERGPITRADVELDIPDGTHVFDWTTNKEWLAGDPDSVKEVDPELRQQIAEAMQAQFEAPQIRAKRTRAMTWIVGGAVALTVFAAAAAYRIRQHRG